MRQRTPMTIGLTLAILLLVVNYLAGRHFARLDLTANREYTLAETTKRTLRELNDVITVRVYFSKDLPPQLSPLRNGVTDLLMEYQRFGGTNLEIEFRDPQESPQSEREVMMLGIQPLSVNVVKKDKQELARIYLGLVMQYGNKQEVIPVDPQDPTQHLEEWLTGGIVKLTREKTPAVGWWAPAERPEGEGYQLVRKLLADRYTIEAVEPPTPMLDVTKIDALVIASPEQVTAEQRTQLAQYLAAGGKAILFLDRVRLDKGFTAIPQTSGLEPLLETYGVKSEAKLVVDAISNYAAIQSQMFTTMVPYPFWPAIRDGLNREHPSVAQLESLTLPWIAPLQLSDTRPAGLEATVLAQTSPQSAVLDGTGPFSVDPDTAIETLERGPLTRVPAIVALRGAFPPDGAPVPATPDAAAAPAGELIVVSTAYLLQDRIVGQRQFAEGVAFFANVVDHFTIGDALIGIRSRPVTARPLAADILKTEREGTRLTIRYANLIGVPLCIVGGGLLAWWRRRRKWQGLGQYFA